MSLNQVSNSSAIQSQFTKISNVLQSKLSKIDDAYGLDRETISANFQAVMPSFIYNLTYAMNGVRKSLQEGIVGIDYSENSYKEIINLLEEAKIVLTNFFDYKLNDSEQTINSISSLSEKLKDINSKIEDYLSITELANKKIFSAEKTIDPNVTTLSGSNFSGTLSVPETFSINGVSYSSNEISAGANNLEIEFENNIEFDLSKVYGASKSGGAYEVNIGSKISVDGIINMYGLKKAGDVGLFVGQTSSSGTAAGSGGGNNTIQFNSADLDPIGKDINDFYAGSTITLTSGSGYSQTKTISAYDASTYTATVDSDWTTHKAQAKNGAALDTIILADDAPDLNYTSASVKIISGPAAGEIRTVSAYNNGTNTLTLDTDWNTNVTGNAASAGSGTNTLALESGDIKTYTNYYSGASVTLTAGITNSTKNITAYNATTNEITVDSDWNISEQGILNHGGVSAAATANTITFSAGASAVNDAYTGSEINVNGEIKTITAYNGATKTATVNSNWADGDGSTITGQDYTIDVAINTTSQYVINNIIPNASSVYQVTFTSDYNRPDNTTQYKLYSSGLYSLDMNESSANYLKPYYTGVKIAGGDSSSKYDITEYESGKYSIVYNDNIDSQKIKIYNFEGATTSNIFKDAAIISANHSGTATGATANTITLAATASATANSYVGSIITVNNESKTVTAYNEITKTATVDSNWADPAAVAASTYTFIKNLGLPGGTLSSSYIDADGKMAVFKQTEAGFVKSTTNQYVKLESTASSVDNYYTGMQISIGSQVRTISSYDGVNKNAWLNEPLLSRTTSSSKYYIYHPIKYFDVTDTDYSNAGSITELSDSISSPASYPEILKSSDGKYYIGYSGIIEENALLQFNNTTQNTIQLNESSSSEDDFYTGMAFYINNGTGAGTYNTITDYDGTTKIATIENTFYGTDNLTITAIGANTIKSSSLSSSLNDYYNNWGIYITSGTGAGQFRRITDYDGTTKTATVDNWTTTPDLNSKFKLMQLPNSIPFSSTISEYTAGSGSISTIRFPDIPGTTNDSFTTFYKGYTVFITGGPGAGQYKDISIYTGGTRTATVASDWDIAPNNTSKFMVMLTDSTEQYTGNNHSAVTQTAGSITFDDTYSGIDDYFNGWGVFITDGTGVGQFRKITDYDGTTKTASIDANWATTPDATSKYTLVKLYEESSYQIISNFVTEIDPADSSNNKTVMQGSISGNTYKNIGLSNDYIAENYRYYSSSPSTSLSDRYNLINLKPYDDIISGDITSDKVSIDSIADNIGSFGKYIVEDYISFNLIDETNGIWEVNSQKYGSLGNVASGDNFWINVNPTQTDISDGDLEIDPDEAHLNDSSKNNFYSISNSQVNSSFLKLNIDNEPYSFGDSFSLRIKDAVVQNADFDNTSGTTSIEQKSNYSLTYADEYGGLFFRKSDDKSIYLSKSVIDFDSSYDSNSLSQVSEIWKTTGTNLPSGKNPVIFEDNKIFFLQTDNYFQKVQFSYDFHSDKDNVSAANNFFDSSNTKINDEATYTNETVYLVYAGSGNWKVYSNQSGQLTNDTAPNADNYIQMAQNGATTNTFTKTGADGGKTSIDISIQGWDDFINGKVNANGVAPASADNVFASGDTIQLKLSHQAVASFNGGPKTNIYEGRENIVGNGNSAISVIWDSANSDFYNNIKPGEYSFNVEINDIKILSSENMDEIDIGLPNQLTTKQLGIYYDNIKFKTPREVYAIYANAKNIVETELNNIRGISELLNGAIDYGHSRIDSLYSSNDKINNQFEAKLRLDQIKSDMISNFSNLNLFNIKSEIVDGLFSFYDNKISV
ncbi:hypothetical protein KA977_04940 [Candidatus Dependentiae bacterium]|nr:hypothetical protein [Candidatus Dependentiae bacterium]